MPSQEPKVARMAPGWRAAELDGGYAAPGRRQCRRRVLGQTPGRGIVLRPCMLILCSSVIHELCRGRRHAAASGATIDTRGSSRGSALFTWRRTASARPLPAPLTNPVAVATGSAMDVGLRVSLYIRASEQTTEHRNASEDDAIVVFSCPQPSSVASGSELEPPEQHACV